MDSDEDKMRIPEYSHDRLMRLARQLGRKEDALLTLMGYLSWEDMVMSLSILFEDKVDIVSLLA